MKEVNALIIGQIKKKSVVGVGVRRMVMRKRVMGGVGVEAEVEVEQLASPMISLVKLKKSSSDSIHQMDLCGLHMKI